MAHSWGEPSALKGDLGEALQEPKRESGKGLFVGGVKLPLEPALSTSRRNSGSEIPAWNARCSA